MGLWISDHWRRLTPAVYLLIAGCSDSFVQFLDPCLSLGAVPRMHRLFSSQRSYFWGKKEEKNSWWWDGRSKTPCVWLFDVSVQDATLSSLPMQRTRLYLLWICVCWHLYCVCFYVFLLMMTVWGCSQQSSQYRGGGVSNPTAVIITCLQSRPAEHQTLPLWFVYLLIPQSTGNTFLIIHLQLLVLGLSLFSAFWPGILYSPLVSLGISPSLHSVSHFSLPIFLSAPLLSSVLPGSGCDCWWSVGCISRTWIFTGLWCCSCFLFCFVFYIGCK